jgi:hypothetical protein
MPPDRPTLSIAVSTIGGWPEIRASVASFEAAAARVGGEVIITDASPHPAPPPGDLAPTTTWHRYPGRSVFQLREIGCRLARAPIIAVTEDHVAVPVDWGERFLAGFAAAPDAMAIGGSVENGATSTLVDWASFFIVQAMIVAPIASGPVGRLSGAVNVAYRAEALQDIDDHGGLGTLDGLVQRDLRKRGALLVADDSIRVSHDQSLGVAPFTALHYHAARTYAGFLRDQMDGQAWFRFLGFWIVPYLRLARAVILLNRRGYGPQVGRALPLMLWLLYAQAAGHVMGFVAGPGDSPPRVR